MTDNYSWFESSPWQDGNQTFDPLPKFGLDIVEDDQITSVSDKTSASALLARESANLAELQLRAQSLQAEKILFQKQLQAKSDYDDLKLQTEINVARARTRVLSEQLSEKSMPLLSTKIQMTNTPLNLPVDLELPTVYPELHNQPHSVPQPTPTPINDIVQRQIELSEMILGQQRRSLLPKVEITKFNGDVSQYRTFIKAFENRVEKYASDDTDKLYFLCQYTIGDPHDIIKSCLHMEPTAGFNKAKRLLKERFGNVLKITAEYMNALLKWPKMKADHHIQLEKFSQKLLTCLNAMSDVHYLKDLNNPQNLRELMDKLPFYMQDRWRRKAHGLGHASFEHFVNFVCEEVDIMANPVFGKNFESNTVSEQRSKPQMHKQSYATGVNKNNHQNTNYQKQSEIKCVFCCGNHDIDLCQEFLKLLYDERRLFARQNRLCYGCLKKYHDSRNCRNKNICRKCGKNHPTVFHLDNLLSNQHSSNARHESNYSQGQYSKPYYTGPLQPSNNSFNNGFQPNVSQNNDYSQKVPFVSNGCANMPDEDLDIMMSVVPVNLYNKDNDVMIKTYVFMDHGSSGCILTNSACSQLQAKGIETQIYLGTMHGQTNIDSMIVKNVQVISLSGEHSIDLPQTYVLNEIPVSKSKIPQPDIVKRWVYLRSIYIPKLYPDIEIGLLIGTNCPQALEPLKVIPSQGKGPYAVLTRLGWTVVGPIANITTNVVNCNRIIIKDLYRSSSIHTVAIDNKIHEVDIANNFEKILEADFKDYDSNSPPYSQKRFEIHGCG